MRKVRFNPYYVQFCGAIKMKIKFYKSDIEILLAGKELIIFEGKEYRIYARLERKDKWHSTKLFTS